jgi:hypothetical protein
MALLYFGVNIAFSLVKSKLISFLYSVSMDNQEPKKLPEEIDKSRRRLTIGALVAPVVLSTFPGKNALAAAPYNCTISGNLSGNTSSHGAPVDCGTLGVSPGCWKSPHMVGPPTRWPAPYAPTTLFTQAFTAWPDGFTQLNYDPTTTTMLDALQTNGNTAGNVAFTRAAVASLLNAVYFAPNYPLDVGQVQQLYNATVNGGSILLSDFFNVTGTTIWYMQDVMNYFQSLYGGESESCPAGFA